MRTTAILVSKSRKVDSSRTCFTCEIVLPNIDSATEALLKFWSLERLGKAPLSIQGLTNMFMKFEVTGILQIQPGRRRKCVAVHVVDDVATQEEENRSQIIGSTSASVD
ncbi:hypothetical protein TNCV_2282361 [Trichonephila clavipes]|nr:hypothetical protein TNCV_2282361 [Trichonephila clavipes]